MQPHFTLRLKDRNRKNDYRDGICLFFARVVQHINNLSVCTDADLLAKSGQGSRKE